MKRNMVVKFKNLINKDCFNIIKKINNKKEKVSKFSIFMDIYKCSLKYNSTYSEYYYYEFYNLNDEERSTFITNSINDSIINKYNNKDFVIKVDDKGELYKEFKEYLNRDYLDLREASFKEFEDFIVNRDKVICNSPNNNKDKLELLDIDKDKLKNEYNILKTYNQIIKSEEYIVEEVIKQNSEISSLYDGCVNSLRITTFLGDNNEVNILNEVLTIGRNGISDKICKDSLICLLDKKGEICLPAIDRNGRTYIEHPITFKRILGFKVPLVKEAEEMAKALAKSNPNVRYVSWFFAIEEEKVSLLSSDSNPVVFQFKPSLTNCKHGILDEYKKYMEI